MVDHKGWHSRGYLPHFDSPETVQFVTFRLADSLPRSVVEALRLQDEAAARIDRELDTGLGACWLGRTDIAAVVENALLHFDSERYRLLAWCIMPNHVHTVVELFGGDALGSILHSWSPLQPTRQTNWPDAQERSGTTITSIAICGTKTIWRSL
jgi:putative transposase